MKEKKGTVLKVLVFLLCVIFGVALGITLCGEVFLYEERFYTNDVSTIYYRIAESFEHNYYIRVYDYVYELDLQKAALPGGRYHYLWVIILALDQIKYWIYLATFALLVLTIASFAWLMKLSGRRPGREEVVPGIINKIPTDIVFLLDSTIIVVLWAGIYEEIYFSLTTLANIIFIAIFLVITYCICLAFCMDMAARIKEKTIFKNTVTYRLLKLIYKPIKWSIKKIKQGGLLLLELFRNLPLIWRTVIVLTVFTMFEAFIIMLCWFEMDNYAIYFVFKTIILVPVILLIALNLRKLQAQGEELSKGNLSYKADTKWLFWDFKKHAETLNNIAKGITVAVNDRIKSEHMKTELITNVSHDIKTPLTSIINYATLISEEPVENDKIKEYSEVLVRQSGRLKHLLEDLVEASKASTGNLEVNMEPCEASVFVTQIAGEYEEKLEAAKLTLVSKVPEEEILILADGRRMLRVFDNLLNNICKYSLEGSRVYISLEKKGEKAIFTFKNTSKAELNISEDELMERFTRGDSSRNTEGNGLGLAIAKSLTELQNGEFRLTVDGDLFKVELTFPTI